MKTALISAVLAFTTLAAIVPAKAYDVSQSTPQIDVPYGDLNLSTAQGTQTMLRRIQGAAAKVCSGHLDNRLAGSLRRYHQCVNIATRNAMARVNANWASASR